MATLWRFALLLSMAIAFIPTATLAMNVIDQCWRRDPDWRRNRYQIAMCSVGFAGKMRNNIGKDVLQYKVTDPSDDPLNPKPGTLRYGATMIPERVWITFKRDMTITLQKPLLISSFTAIDGRGVNVHVTGAACMVVYKANNIIIHSLYIHHCRAEGASTVMGPDRTILQLGEVDGDAIRLVTASKIWIDHNTLYDCQDGLIDVTRGSTDITISNNWFRNQDKVMLLGHDDGYVRDKNMKVTVAFNHFGPSCNQRMPRVRHGFTHVVNNLYQGWTQYAIGGSMNPSIKSQSNLFIAPKSGNKEVTWSLGDSWKLYSVGDVFENGAFFNETGSGKTNLYYTEEQRFEVADANTVRSLTSASGVLKCSRASRC
ncbi:Pectate lyase [Melia azedarach]|uniref:Pectate lyase n=1 Tax=Melia azedarach TaxID=155640 RepID=A0ACC1XTT7_MELAZ|nr:Pectate lyase [Melia azedarach]